MQHKPFIKIIALLFLAMTFASGLINAEEVASENAESSQPMTFEQAAAELTKKVNFRQQEENLVRLASYEDERVYDILYSYSENTLFYIKETKQLVSAINVGDSYKVTVIMTGEVLDRTSKRGLKKVKSKNSLRKKASEYVAILALKSPKVDIRKSALYEVIEEVDEPTYSILVELKEKETNEEIRELIQVGMAMWEINADDQATRLQAIATLSESLIPEVRVKLAGLTGKYSSGEYIETDQAVRVAVTQALNKIDDRISFFGFLDNVVFGLSLGSVLLLIAIGLAITFGVMGVINMAHGELMMIGAYTAFVVQQLLPSHIGLSVFVAIPLAFLVSAMFGIAIERFVIRYMYGRPLETLLATFGISLMLQQLVRVIFGPTNQAVETPLFMSGSLEINPVFAITYNRLYIFIFSIMVLLALIYILKRTRLGLQVRAVSQNRAIARAMGVRSEWVDALTFGLGAGIAGIAGVALSQLTNVGPNLGQSYIIDSFMVVVFGGVGNLWGTFVAAMSLGVISKFMEPWAGAVLAKILVLVFIILFIQKKPRGLFPQKGRAAES
ncbi:MAG: urea ABC transporter permease subunit UrtB [Thioalkalispiraceae bacterium]|jgi:urea transport system permease protein